MPTIEDKTPSSSTGENNQCTINFPATVNANDLLITAISIDGAGAAFPATEADSTGDDHTLLDAIDNASCGAAVYWKRADGDEDGGSIVVEHSGGNESFAALVIRISGAHLTQDPESTEDSGDDPNDTQNPPITPSWGAEADTMIIACGMPEGAPDSAPTLTNYLPNPLVLDTDYVDGGAGVQHGHVETAHRLVNTTTETPPVWANQITPLDEWTAITVAVRNAAAAGGPGGIAVRQHMMRTFQ